MPRGAEVEKLSAREEVVPERIEGSAAGALGEAVEEGEGESTGALGSTRVGAGGDLEKLVEFKSKEKLAA